MRTGKQICYYIDSNILAKLDAHCKSVCCQRSRIVNRAIAEYLDRQEQAKVQAAKPSTQSTVEEP
jgi:predicted transcriptional regulator